MRLDRSLASSLGFLAVVALGATALLAGCSSAKQYDDDDDSGGASGASSSSGGAGSTCDSKHACKSGLTCTSGVCIAKSTGAGGSGGTGGVTPGTLGSTCDAGDACNAGLHCYSGVCIPEQVGSGGTSSADQGTLAGQCYPNDTCNSGLVCLAGYCLPDTGSGGASSGGSGGDASPGSGGSTGGSAQGGSSGDGGTGGSTGGSGGSTGGTGGSTGGAGGSTGGAGGSTSTGGTGGSTGGTGGSTGGTGGSSGASSTLILAEDGWVADGSNSVGIVGPWYIFYDRYSTIFALPNGPDFTGAGEQICVEGTVSQSDEYGPTVALNLNQPDAAGDPLGYVPADHGVTGFSFDISGSPMPSSVQVTFSGTDMSSYCRFFTPPSTSNSVKVSQAILDCWNGSGTSGSTSTAYEAIQFQLPVNYFADGQEFHYCISNLRALTN
jgi:hypothetical protein